MITTINAVQCSIEKLLAYGCLDFRRFDGCFLYTEGAMVSNAILSVTVEPSNTGDFSRLHGS